MKTPQIRKPWYVEVPIETKIGPLEDIWIIGNGTAVCHWVVDHDAMRESDIDQIKAHAAYIVLCVNQHEALEQRCARLEKALQIMVNGHRCDDHCEEVHDAGLKCIHEEARAVLSETKEGK